ncbi:hypothetical protein BH11VER1_BH11VER1_23540 [soil metagenome]
MARRAKSSFKPTHLISVFALVGVLAYGGYSLMRRSGSDGNFAGTTDLDVQEYLENSNALSGNTYRIEGIVEERLDNWRSSEGRLYSVLVDSGNSTSPVPVLIPSKFSGTNIQRGQRFKFKVIVQAESGLLEVVEVSKS